MLRTGKRGGDADASVYQPAADAVGTKSLAIRDWKNLTRIVGEQIYPDGVEMPERGMAPVLQIGRMSVPAEVDAEWNAWYSGEYVPGYRKVPGVIYARRYRVFEGTSGYSTVYEFASTAVPESPEWKEQQQHSSPNSPRMRQAMTHAPGSAGVYVRVNP